MLSIDTNILLYSLLPESSLHLAARAYLDELNQSRSDVVLCELVLAELYVLLRNPKVMKKPLQPQDACEIIHTFRQHPFWRLVEHAPVMENVWKHASQNQFARRRLYDIRLALTLIHHGVTELATTNTRDFKGLGFCLVFNPLQPH